MARLSFPFKRKGQWLTDVASRQQNIVFPNTVQNQGRFWRNLYATVFHRWTVDRCTDYPVRMHVPARLSYRRRLPKRVIAAVVGKNLKCLRDVFSSLAWDRVVCHSGKPEIPSQAPSA